MQNEQRGISDQKQDFISNGHRGTISRFFEKKKTNSAQINVEEEMRGS